MQREKLLSEMKRSGVVAVVRAANEETAERIAQACVAGGITVLEVTMTVPGAIGVIASLSQKYAGTPVVVGAGTVTDMAQAAAAFEAGARFIVSPHLDPGIIAFAHQNDLVGIAGAMTPSEVVACVKAGSDIVKIFPAGLFGPAIIKALRGPFPDLPLMPTGGVSADNAGEWIAAGACAVGAGGELTAGAKTGDFDLITQTAKKMTAAVSNARK